MAVNIADRIAYINHDIDDAVAGGFITLADLPKDCVKLLGKRSSERINSMIFSIVRQSENQNKVEMEPEIAEATAFLRAFLFRNVYNDDTFKKEEEKADKMISALYGFYYDNPEKMPEFNQSVIEKEGIDTAVCDYISSMSDIYVVKKFTEYFIPERWKF